MTSCEVEYTPKPKSYPRVVFPTKAYRDYIDDHCPFTFRYPTYDTILHAASFFDQHAQNYCWMNIEYPPFQQRIHLSYMPITVTMTLEKLEADAQILTNKHIIKAESIDGTKFINPYGVEGLIFDVGGDAASAIQFYMTDRYRHFIRGALYFYTTPNADSLQPMIRFTRKDLDTLIKSFNFKK